MMKENNRRVRSPRWRRKQQVLVLLAWQKSRQITQAQIAFWLEGIQPGSHFLGILNEMEEQKMISSLRLPYRQNATKILWSITKTGLIVADLLIAQKLAPDEV